MKSGDKVRLKSDPSRVGVLSGEEQIRGDRRRLEVRLFDGVDQFFLENALELVPSDDTNPYALFRKSRYGRLRDLRGSLTYYRLSGKLANLIYSMDTTNTEFYAYQYKPVVSFLDSPNHGLLIADEVGLGKTIEAGLIWTELRSRFDARRLLIICPAILREKWQDELSKRFGIEAEICSARDLINKIKRYKNSDLDEFAAIVSLQGIRPPRNWQDKNDSSQTAAGELAHLFDELEDEDPIFDLTIIDEAHYLRNPESQTSKLGSLIRPITDGLIMLSATPIQLKSVDLFHLVKFLDEATFNNELSFDRALESSRPLLELRDAILKGKCNRKTLQKKLEEAQQYSQLSHSQQIKYILENLPSDENLIDYEFRAELAETVDRINPLSHVISRTRKRDVHERRVLRDARAIRVGMTTVEEQFYLEVTEKVRKYCAQFNLHEGFLLTIPQRQMTSSMAAACRSWLKKEQAEINDDLLIEALSVDLETELKKINLGPLTIELISIAKKIGNYEVLKAEDSKFKFLLKHLNKYWGQYPDNKVILFSFYRETLAYLNERFNEESVSNIVLQGGSDKQLALATFKSVNGPKLLLASEVASEGVDLQFSSILINYDLPWNPQRIEQRIGRIDRIGQKEEKINIWNIFHENTIDDRVYTRLLERLDIFKSALGSIESVLGADIRKMSYKLFSHNLSENDESKVIEQTAQAVATRQVHEQKLEEQASFLVAHGDYIQNKVKAAKDLKRFISGKDIYNYVKDFCDDEYPGSRFERISQEKLLFKIDLSDIARFEFGEYLRASRLLGKTRLSLATQKMRFLFENRVVTDSPDEIISQFHPFIRFIGEKYKSKGIRKYFPVVSLEISSLNLPSIEPGTYIFAIERWSMRIAFRDTEQLAYRALKFNGEEIDVDKAELLVNTVIHLGQDWLSASNELDGSLVEELFTQCIEILEEKYQSYIGSMQRENHDRLEFQRINILTQFERKEKEWTQRISQMRFEKKEKGARLWEGKLKKNRLRANEILTSIEKSATPSHDKILVNSGVIKVI
jgi:superfamily II DNA or RNA helicase